VKTLLAWIAGAALVLAADTPTISYTKTFPGSVPAYAAITLARDGSATYKEAADEEPEVFKVEPAATAAIFELAAKLDHFKRRLESNLKVAKMGQKTFRWDEGGNATVVSFNFSEDLDARELADWFERITESERILLDLRRTARFDRLGVHEILLRLDSAWQKKRVVGMEQFLQPLDRIAKNDSYLHMAREKATQLAEAFRAAAKAE
jgi:hypothetical protein